MKKNFINGLILMALFVAAGTMTSCKDTYQDLRTEMQSQIDYQATVGETLKSQVATLTTELENLKALQQDCKSTCTAKFDELNDKVAALQTLVADVKAAAEAGDANLQTQITALQAEIAAKQAEIDALKEQIAALQAEDALLQSAIDTLTAGLAEVKEQVATNTKDIADVVASVADVNKTAVAAAAKAEEALALAKDNESALNELKATVTTINSTIAGWGDRLTAVEKEAAAAAAKAEANEARIAALETLTKQQTEDITALKSSLETLTNTVNALGGKVTTLEQTVSAQEAKLAELDKQLASYAEELQTVKALAEEAKTLAEKADSLADEAKSLAQDGLTKAAALETQLSDLKAAFEEAEAKTQVALDALQSSIDTLTAKINKAWGQLITSIIIQGTWNPVYGEMAAPLDVRSNVLAALYGEAANDVYFPTDKPSCYVDAEDVPTFTQADAALIAGFNTSWFDAGDVVIDEEEGNAGTIYLTVNPSDVDFTGTQFTLVNSLDEESKVTLSSLKASDHLLTYGWTRAENGFYEAKATLTAEDVESVKIRFDLEQAKSTIKELRNITSGLSAVNINVTDLLLSLQDDMSGLLEADGVKATWTDELTGAQKSVYSQYGIAATSIKPLSFNFLKDWNAPKLPHISPFDYTVDMKLNYAEYTDVPHQNFTVKIDVDGDGEPESFTVEGVNDFIDLMNDKVGGNLEKNVNELIDQIQSQVNKNVDKLLNKVNSQVVTRVNSLIDKVNARLSNVNHYLQPCLVYQTNEGTYFQASTTWYAPTHFTLSGDGEQGILLTPTSYTAEMLAPAFKKLVAVTNVYNSDYSANAQDGDATCKAALEKANTGEGMNTVYGGAADILFLTDAAYAGYVYELLYTAVDYSGKVVANKYYVKVSK